MSVSDVQAGLRARKRQVDRSSVPNPVPAAESEPSDPARPVMMLSALGSVILVVVGAKRAASLAGRVHWVAPPHLGKLRRCSEASPGLLDDVEIAHVGSAASAGQNHSRLEPIVVVEV